MKHRITLCLAATLLLTLAACKKSDLPGFTKTESGLHYQFLVENADGQQVQLHDVLRCEIILALDHDTLYSNMGNPQLLLQAADAQFYGSIEEGLLMLRQGDEAIFAVEADSVALYHNMPASYTAGTGQKLYYTIRLNDIVTADSIAKAEAAFVDNMNMLRQGEQERLEAYIRDNNITAQPNADGLYLIINKKGKGKAIAAGSQVAFNYTGRRLDGTVFDSNVQSIAEEAGIYDSRRTYAPEQFVMGEAHYVKALQDGMEGLTPGTQATLIAPSALGFGSVGRGEKIAPYTTLVYDIEIISVD